MPLFSIFFFFFFFFFTCSHWPAVLLPSRSGLLALHSPSHTRPDYTCLSCTTVRLSASRAQPKYTLVCYILCLMLPHPALGRSIQLSLHSCYTRHPAKCHTFNKGGGGIFFFFFFFFLLIIVCRPRWFLPRAAVAGSSPRAALELRRHSLDYSSQSNRRAQVDMSSFPSAMTSRVP